MQNKIGLGSVQFGSDYGISNSCGKTDLKEVCDIIRYGQQQGIRYLDTAHAYGVSEEVLGNFDLSYFRIISKYLPDGELDLRGQFEETLGRLNVKSLYGYLAHRPLDLLEKDCANWRILLDLKVKKQVEKVGASFNSVEELDQVLAAGIQLDIIQVPYNYLDRRFEKTISQLKASGCEIHARSAFLQGLFFCDPQKLSPFFEEVKHILTKIQECENYSGQLLRFVVANSAVDVVIIGVNNLRQLRQNIDDVKETKFTLPPLEVNIDSRLLMPSEWPKMHIRIE